MKLGTLQKKWVASLKTHPERQLKRQLGRKFRGDRYKACCLGEGGLIAGICEFDTNGELRETRSRCISTLSKHYGELGLFSEAGRERGYDIITGGVSLADLNDDGKHTWVDIAYLIEAAPELFFSKSV